MALVARIGCRIADVVLASPTRRAVETASILTGLPADAIATDALCLERDYGLLQGLDREGVRRYADQIEYLEVGGINHSLNPPCGETFEEVRARAEQFLDSLRSLPGRSVLVVSHQVFLQQLHGLLLGYSTRESLGLDILSLEVDRFAVGRAGPTRREVIYEGERRHASW